MIVRMVICGHRLNRHVLDRQCKDYSRQHQLVQQILILQFSLHYHYHHLVGHFHQHLLIWILIHHYGRRITTTIIQLLLHRHHLNNINHVYISMRMIRLSHEEIIFFSF